MPAPPSPHPGLPDTDTAPDRADPATRTRDPDALRDDPGSDAHHDPSQGSGPDHAPDAGPSDDELADWLRLTLTPGLGAVKGQTLLRHLGPPAQILRTRRATLAQLVGARLADALLTTSAVREQHVARTLSWRAEAPGQRHLLALDDPAYPPALLHLNDPPLLLYAEGRLSTLNTPHTLAIVGSRNASPEGLRNAFAFAEALARRGLLIASGLAEGIDCAAHRGALAGGDTRQPCTLAVIGSGLDRIYPAHHRPIARQLIEHHGLLLSEQALGSAPLRGNFPRRNRMIAALAQGVLVVEAALQSGSLITARLANELGREVMAIPGSIHNPLAHGCHYLLRDGATLVETVDDVLQALGLLPLAPSRGHPAARSDGPTPTAPRSRLPAPEAMRPPDPAAVPAGTAGLLAGKMSGMAPARSLSPPMTGAPSVDDATRQLLACLQGSPQSAEALASQLGWPIQQTLGCIQLAEIRGQISRHVDGRWQRLPS